MLVARHGRGLAAFTTRHTHRYDFGREEAARLRVECALLAAQRERVLVRPGDPTLHRDVLGGLRHSLDTEAGFEILVDETPPQGRVLNSLLTPVGGRGLAHHQRGARHRFHAASQRQIDLTREYRARSATHCVETGAAQAVDGHARNTLRQAGQQQAHARDVAVVLTRLVGATEVHLVELRPVD